MPTFTVSTHMDFIADDEEHAATIATPSTATATASADCLTRRPVVPRFRVAPHRTPRADLSVFMRILSAVKALADTVHKRRELRRDFWLADGNFGYRVRPGIDLALGFR